MLSRTADNLYWLARYVERAESLARILEATQRLTAMPLEYVGETNEWESALATAGYYEDRKWGERSRWLVALAAWSREPARATRDVALAASIGGASCCLAWLVLSSPARSVAHDVGPLLALAASPPAIERSASGASASQTVPITVRSIMPQVFGSALARLERNCTTV